MSMDSPDVIRLFELDEAIAKGRSWSVMGATGFIGSRYCAMYPNEAQPERSRWTDPLLSDVLYLRSTVDNYWPVKGDLKTDITTNLLHLSDVLPNVIGTFNLISTWFCYGSAAGTTCDHPACETDPCDPNGWYSITALAREKLLRSYYQTISHQSYRILRLCNVIGNDPRAGKQKNALEMMLGKVVRGETVEVYEGDNYRDILHVEDVCRAIHLCINTPGTLNSITNIGRGESHRMIDIVEYAIAKTGSRSEVKRVPVPAFHRAVQVADFWMDTARLAALGYRPELSLWESVDRVLAGLNKTL